MLMKGVDCMALSPDTQQISVVLPKSIVEKLDKLSQEELRTRSQQAAKIIIDYFKEDSK
jgi:metal-responsive CopG/Arc/MetJ family transcriptional regulator